MFGGRTSLGLIEPVLQLQRNTLDKIHVFNHRAQNNLC
jgi:hypothetical protein